MPSPLSQTDATNFWEIYSPQLLGYIPTEGSVVLSWIDANENQRFVLVYHSADDKWYFTDITDLGQTTINNLAQQSTVHGVLWYLPQSVVEVVSEDIEALNQNGVLSTATDAVQQVATAVGNAIGAAIQPATSTLMPAIIVIGALAFIYLFKKG